MSLIQDVVGEITRISGSYENRIGRLEATILEQAETIEQMAAELERLRDAGG